MNTPYDFQNHNSWGDYLTSGIPSSLVKESTVRNFLDPIVANQPWLGVLEITSNVMNVCFINLSPVCP